MANGPLPSLKSLLSGHQRERRRRPSPRSASDLHQPGADRYLRLRIGEARMGSLGETLRQARLDRGASLVDAAQETRIPRRYLEAREPEDYASLPARVCTRGRIRDS